MGSQTLRVLRVSGVKSPAPAIRPGDLHHGTRLTA